MDYPHAGYNEGRPATGAAIDYCINYPGKPVAPHNLETVGCQTLIEKGKRTH